MDENNGRPQLKAENWNMLKLASHYPQYLTHSIIQRSCKRLVKRTQQVKKTDTGAVEKNKERRMLKSQYTHIKKIIDLR